MMYKKIFFLILFLFFNLNFSFPSSKRIISLAPSITEAIYLLKKEDTLVGNTIYCKIPKEAQYKEKVGTIVDANLEKILTLRPDIVIATELTNQKTIEKLRQLNIEVVKFHSPKNFKELCSQFLELAKILGKEKEAEEIIKEAEKKLSKIEDNIKNLPKVKVFVEIQAKPLMGIGNDSFIDDFIKLAGGINIVDTKTGIYLREEVVKKNPDVIVILDMGIDHQLEIKKWERYKIDAVKNKKIYIFNSYKLCSPTPVSFVNTLEELIDILHK